MSQDTRQPREGSEKGQLQQRRAFLQLLMGSAALVTVAGLAGCDTTSSPDGSSSSSNSSSNSSSSSSLR
jgi:hypothetical protein